MPLKLRRPALAILLTLSAAVSAHGGEWHSAGNAPKPPYIPKGQVNELCLISITTGVGANEYRIDRDLHFTTADFQIGSYGRANFEVKDEKDPLMNGQSFALSFEPNAKGGEDLVLAISANFTDGVYSVGTRTQANSPRSAGSIDGSAILEIDNQNEPSRSIHIEVRCSETKKGKA